jgi:hypothetical protein
MPFDEEGNQLPATYITVVTNREEANVYLSQKTKFGDLITQLKTLPWFADKRCNIYGMQPELDPTKQSPPSFTALRLRKVGSTDLHSPAEKFFQEALSLANLSMGDEHLFHQYTEWIEIITNLRGLLRDSLVVKISPISKGGNRETT